VASSENYDVQWISNRVTVRQAPGDIVFELALEPPNIIRAARGKLWRNGRYLALSPTAITDPWGSSYQCTVTRCRKGIVVLEEYDNRMEYGSALCIGLLPKEEMPE
jgi:hypothetical protein